MQICDVLVAVAVVVAKAPYLLVTVSYSALICNQTLVKDKPAYID